MATHYNFRTILCPVDFSEHSRAALHYAQAIARRAGGRLFVLFVSDPLLAAAAAAAYDERWLSRTAELELRRFTSRALGRTFADKTTFLVTLGNPALEISRAVRRVGADLVVLGTQGLGGPSKLYFGSTTECVLRRARVPILAVPATMRPRVAAASRSWPTRVLAAIELGHRAAADARRASAVAHWFRKHLLLVTVITPPPLPSWMTIRRGRVAGLGIAEARKRLRQIAGRLGRPAVAVRVLTGDPAEQIGAAAADWDAGLIVLTLRPSDRLFGARQGSVAYQVLRDAALPLLALPDHVAAARGIRR